MRIALLTYSTRARGGVVHTLALAEALAAAGEDVTVVTLDRGGGFFRRVEGSVRLELVPLPDGPAGEDVGARIVRSITVLAAALRALTRAGGRAGRTGPGGPWDVVHAQDCLSANAALDAGLRVLRTVHHLDAFTTPELVACHERAITAVHGHVCVSAAVAAELAAGWGLRARVIGNGVDAARFAAAASDEPAAVAARARWRERLGPHVLAVGGIEPRKGTLDLVEAMALLRRTHPEVRLVIAGGQTLFDHRAYAAAVADRAARLGVEPVDLGPIDDDALPSLVASASAFAFCSTKEGFGLAAMEALAARVPLVVRDLPVLREVFDGAARFATSPPGFAAALGRALDDPGELVGAGSALAASCTWSSAAAAHRDLYADWVSGA